MSGRTSRTIVPWLAGLAIVGLLGAGAGFALGLRWPLEGLEERLGLRTSRFAADWTPFATSDLTRYENLRIEDGDRILLLGGFRALEAGSGDALATARVEVLDLASRAFEPRGDMPVALTHGGAVRMGDTVWVVGGFEGDHPGPATDRVWLYDIPSDRWTPGPALPAPRGGGALVAVGDTLHFFGGWLPDRNTDSPDHWTRAPGDSVWREAAPMPLLRGHLSAAVLDGSIYAISGNIGHDPVPVDVRAVHRYDPLARRWESVAPLPFAVSHTEASTLVYDGGILVAGGRARPDGRQNLDDLLFYDPDRDRWRHLGRMPLPLLGATTVLRGDTLILGLGAEIGNDPTNVEFWASPLRDRWRRADTLPVPLFGVGAAVLGDDLHVIGGGSTRTHVFDLAAGRWRPEGSAPDRPMIGHASAVEVVDGRLFVLGGLGWSRGLVQVFDPEGDRWRLGPGLPDPVGAVASAVVAGEIYVAGGLTADSAVATAVVLDPRGAGWRHLPPLPLPRSHAAGGTDGRHFYLFGGRGTDGVPTREVQRYDPEIGAWAVVGELPDARAETGRALYRDGEFWIVGGASPVGPTARVDVYDPVTGAWRRGPDLPAPRSGVTPVLDGGRILAAGGTGAEGAPLTAFEILWPRR